MKLILTNKIPTNTGLYYWTATDKPEHTPAVLEVVKVDGKLYAQGEEYNFYVKNDKESLWCQIPYPIVDGEVVKPYSY